MSNDSEIRLVTERLAEMMPDLLDAVIITLKHPQRVFFLFNSKQIPCSTCVIYYFSSYPQRDPFERIKSVRCYQLIRRCRHPPLMLFLPLTYAEYPWPVHCKWQ